MSLFEFAAEQRLQQSSPLADRMRPATLEEFMGQEGIIGEGRLLRRAIAADQLSSIVLYGPPGTGKTTLAHIIAQSTSAQFEQVNATSAGVADIRRVIDQARERLATTGQRTVIFVDEIHRFNKGQQDALLPAVERGLVVLIGATTENPFFSINSPLLSRSRIFKLESLKHEQLQKIAQRALQEEKGLGKYPVELEEGALDHLIRSAGGDARSVLNALETAVLSTPPGDDGKIRITVNVAEESIQQRIILYDKSGDKHYDVISAFIKSMRGSDPDATLYWMACMIKAGEDPRFIARRIMICASEDVGNADPRALQVAVAAAQAVEMLGLPEGRLPLAQAAIYVAGAPKSNATCVGIDSALSLLEKGSSTDVPIHLRDASYKGAKQLGHGKNYLYPHDHPGTFVTQDYLPAELKGTKFYAPEGRGYEKNIRERLTQWWGDKWKSGL